MNRISRQVAQQWPASANAERDRAEAAQLRSIAANVAPHSPASALNAGEIAHSGAAASAFASCGHGSAANRAYLR
jgi:hypothetical protein